MLDCVTYFIYLGQCSVLSQSHCPVLLHAYLHLKFCYWTNKDGWIKLAMLSGETFTPPLMHILYGNLIILHDKITYI